MRAIMLPNREWVVEKSRTNAGNVLQFTVKATKYSTGAIYLGGSRIATPKELIGKKVYIKLELVDE